MDENRSMSSSEEVSPFLEWKFCQVFGEPNKSPIDEITEVDIVSAVEFDQTGEFLAAGDKGGRVVVFERVHSPDSPCEYKFYAEFQSHEPEFDYLKSLEIEEKINKIKWVNGPASANQLYLLTTNDKTIKLWKVYDKKVAVGGYIAQERMDGELSFPSPSKVKVQKTAVARKTFANAHAYHINSISPNSDGESFISSDDLRINLWNLEINDQTFNIVDIKPENMEELTEVITSAEFHPLHCHHFMYSSSKGTVKLADMRAAALCDTHAKVFEEEEDPSSKSFFSEIISSISDIKFSACGRYFVSRDYLSLKLWDVNMERRPVKTIRIHDHLRSKLCDLYENDCIFDKFECTPSTDGQHLLTGSYHNYFQIYDLNSTRDLPDRPPRRSTRIKLGRNKPKEGEMNPDTMDFNKKVLHVAWHPQEDIIAIGASNNLYLYAAEVDDGEDSVSEDDSEETDSDEFESS